MDERQLRYRLKGGRTVSGHSAESLVAAMMARSPTMPKSERHYMRDVARRCHVWNESVIPTANAETFVQALIEQGFLTPIKRNR